MWLDPDTVLSPGSPEAALRAAGGVVAAVECVMNGEARRAFCAVRPPGHHATSCAPMGFCLFNAIAVGADPFLMLDLRLGKGEMTGVAARTTGQGLGIPGQAGPHGDGVYNQLGGSSEGPARVAQPLLR